MRRGDVNSCRVGEGLRKQPEPTSLPGLRRHTHLGTQNQALSQAGPSHRGLLSGDSPSLEWPRMVPAGPLQVQGQEMGAFSIQQPQERPCPCSEEAGPPPQQ